MNIKHKFLIAILTLYSVSLYGQKNITHQNLAWYGYYLTLQFNDKWYWQTEFQERQFINPTAQSQFLVRSHLHRTLGSSGWETSAGMSLFLQNPNDPKATVKLTIPELRPHIEFTYKQKLKHLTFDNRYRVEGRFFHNTNQPKTELEDGYDFGTFRFRYRLQATVPIFRIDDKRLFKIKVSDEILLNAGSKIVLNVFDQNRIYGGLSIDLLPNLTFDVGYLKLFQMKTNGDYYNRDILSLNVFQKINLQKNKSEKK